jgi:hypothetical protein
MQTLLNDSDDRDDTLLYAEPIPLAKDTLNLTTEERQLRLLHIHIKLPVVVPFNPTFEALPRNNLLRPTQLRLPERAL